MAHLVEQLFSGVLDLLSRADEKFTAYNHKRRADMHLKESGRNELLAAIHPRAEAWENSPSK